MMCLRNGEFQCRNCSRISKCYLDMDCTAMFSAHRKV